MTMPHVLTTPLSAQPPNPGSTTRDPEIRRAIIGGTIATLLTVAAITGALVLAVIVLSAWADAGAAGGCGGG